MTAPLRRGERMEQGQPTKGFDLGSLYAGERVALLTKHGKEGVIAPVLEPGLGCAIERVSGYDTDLLGTFTREIPRDGTQIEAARKKARIGMDLSRMPLGLASEGSFGPDPILGAVSWNVECLVFIDDRLGIEVSGWSQGEARSGHLLAEDWGAVREFALRVGFPDHGVVLRPGGMPGEENDMRIRKEIPDWTALEGAFREARSLSPSGRVFLEIDLRAHANPTRREMIRRAAENLLEKIRSLCPACGLPGFSKVELVKGLSCADCGSPTNEVRAEVHGCLKCAHRAVRERSGPGKGNPLYCDYCNP